MMDVNNKYRVICLPDKGDCGHSHDGLDSAIACAKSLGWSENLMIEKFDDSTPRRYNSISHLTLQEAVMMIDDEIKLKGLEKDFPPCPDEANMDTSLIETWKDAVQGSPKAQYQMGWAYENGLGIRKSRTKAFGWYEKARDNGDKNALLALGNLRWGDAIAWFEQSIELLTKYCNKGDPMAMMFLGRIYDSGYGFNYDPTKAMQ